VKQRNTRYTAIPDKKTYTKAQEQLEILWEVSIKELTPAEAAYVCELEKLIYSYEIKGG